MADMQLAVARNRARITRNNLLSRRSNHRNGRAEFQEKERDHSSLLWSGSRRTIVQALEFQNSLPKEGEKKGKGSLCERRLVNVLNLKLSSTELR